MTTSRCMYFCHSLKLNEAQSISSLSLLDFQVQKHTLAACLVCYNLQNNLGKPAQLTHTALILKCSPYSDWVFILEVEMMLCMSTSCWLLVNQNTDHYLLPTLLLVTPIWPWSTQCKILHHSSRELLLLLLLVLHTGGFQGSWLEPLIHLWTILIMYSTLNDMILPESAGYCTGSGSYPTVLWSVTCPQMGWVLMWEEIETDHSPSISSQDASSYHLAQSIQGDWKNGDTFQPV